MSRKPHGIPCPHCGSGTATRSSRGVAPTYRQLTLQCSNAECGATYGAELSITHIISLSAQPNPLIALRTVPPRRASNDDFPPAANDSGPEVPRAANDDQHAGAVVG